jgi:DNA-binding transcriptional LysR family regulator
MDMVAAGIDVSIRVGRLADSSHKAALIAQFDEWVLATPDFIAGRVPQAPEQLAALPFVGLSVLPNPLNWTFVQQGQASVPVRFNASIMANTSAAVKASVMAGAGVMIQPHFTVLEDLAAGRLVRLLPQWSLQGGGIYAVFPALVQRSQKVTVFVEALKQRYEALMFPAESH